jgi:predicted porin
MNKKLVAAAVAAGLAAPMAAQAEITVYSHVQFEIANIDPEVGDSATVVTDNQRGRIGVKGGHDLGGGLKSWAKAEFDFEGGNRDAEFGSTTRPVKDSTGAKTGDTYTVRNALRVREINAGLKGSFGSIGLGTVKSAYKYYGGVKYDPFVTTTLEARGTTMRGGTDGQNGFLNNALIYTGKFGMVNLHLTYSPDDTNQGGGATGVDGAGETTAGIKFGDKAWEAGAAMYSSGLDNGRENLKVFGSFKFGNNTIRAQWEDTDDGSATNPTTEYMWLGYELKLGKGMLNVQYGMADPDGNNNDTEALTLGYIHKFNKQSRVFVGYKDVDEDAAGEDFSILSAGIRVDI